MSDAIDYVNQKVSDSLSGVPGYRERISIIRDVCANGYKPTTTLRVYLMQSGESLLQQMWVSDEVGCNGIWRNVTEVREP